MTAIFSIERNGPFSECTRQCAQKARLAEPILVEMSGFQVTTEDENYVYAANSQPWVAGIGLWMPVHQR